MKKSMPKKLESAVKEMKKFLEDKTRTSKHLLKEDIKEGRTKCKYVAYIVYPKNKVQPKDVIKPVYRIPQELYDLFPKEIDAIIKKK